MTAAAGAAAAMATGLGIGLDEQQVVSPEIRHLLPRRHQVRLSTMPLASSSSSSPKGSNVGSATNWGTGRKTAVQVSTPYNVPEKCFSEYIFSHIDAKRIFFCVFYVLRFLENFLNSARPTIECIRKTFLVSRFSVNRKKALISFRNNLESSNIHF
jgi:hypothetical protein